jgi:hypothetical protein
MIPMMIGNARRMFQRRNKSVREIARPTSLSCNTVAKYVNVEVQDGEVLVALAGPKFLLREDVEIFYSCRVGILR